MNFEEGFLDGDDGLRLHVGFMRDKAARGWVVLAHGFGEHFERYAHVARYLNSLHYSVFAFDFRGYGRSEGSRGAIDRYEDYVDDFKAALAYLKEHEGITDVHLLAHSQGGLITNYFLKTTDFTPLSLVLSAPAMRFCLKVPIWKRAVGQVASHLAPTLSIPSGIDPFVLSHDRELCAAYNADPLVVRDATARWFTESLRVQEELLAEPFEVGCPTLMLQGGDDQLIDPLTNRAFFETMKAPRKELREYEGFYHEILNEVDKERVFDDLSTWYASV